MSGERSKPDFAAPPVVETALGIQFAPLARLSTRDVGAYALKLADGFPMFEERPRLPRIHETFPQQHTITWELGSSPGPQRAFLLSVDRASMIQIQSDRFGYNWRATTPGASYPRYSENSVRCLQEFRQFRAFCEQHALEAVRPDLCEVVYVNHIAPRESETAVEVFAEIFPALTWSHSTPWLPIPETASLNRVYEIPPEQGRLYAEASIAHRPDGTEFVILKMIARVLHPSGDPETVETSLQLAHEWVVHGFVSLTAEDARMSRWRQKP